MADDLAHLDLIARRAPYALAKYWRRIAEHLDGVARTARDQGWTLVAEDAERRAVLYLDAADALESGKVAGCEPS